MRLLHYVRNDNDLRIFYQQYEKSLFFFWKFINNNEPIAYIGVYIVSWKFFKFKLKKVNYKF